MAYFAVTWQKLVNKKLLTNCEKWLLIKQCRYTVTNRLQFFQLLFEIEV